jgi:hypothetical protein
MTGTKAGPVIAMEIFIEQQMVPPMGIALELFGAAVHWTPASFVAQEDFGQPSGDFPGDIEQVHQDA